MSPVAVLNDNPGGRTPRELPRIRLSPSHCAEGLRIRCPNLGARQRLVLDLQCRHHANELGCVRNVIRRGTGVNGGRTRAACRHGNTDVGRTLENSNGLGHCRHGCVRRAQVEYHIRRRAVAPPAKFSRRFVDDAGNRIAALGAEKLAANPTFTVCVV